ncbi:MAG: hypothetical protein LUE89_09475 [Clostridiales bacterium]|nr:hypothetical protein [Clostridiales bacterium]
MKTRKNTNYRDPFDQPVHLAVDRVLSLVALGVGAAALALHANAAMIAIGVVALAIGLLGLAFGTW